MSTETIATEFKTREEFAERCRLASECDWADPTSASHVVLVGFIVSLLRHFRTWRNELRTSHEVLTSVKYLLRSQNVRKDLANVFFTHGIPSSSQLETVFRLLFVAAAIRHSLVESRAIEQLISRWSAEL